MQQAVCKKRKKQLEVLRLKIINFAYVSPRVRGDEKRKWYCGLMINRVVERQSSGGIDLREGRAFDTIQGKRPTGRLLHNIIKAMSNVIIEWEKERQAGKVR